VFISVWESVFDFKAAKEPRNSAQSARRSSVKRGAEHDTVKVIEPKAHVGGITIARQVILEGGREWQSAFLELMA